MPPDRLAAVVDALRAFVAERDWQPFHDPKNLAMAVASEAGELLAELRWVRSEDADALARDPVARARLQDEIADVGTTLLLLCDRVGVDLVDAIVQKLEKTRAKYPVETSRGRAEPLSS